MEIVLIQVSVARPGLLGPGCFSSNTLHNDTGEDLQLPSTPQIAVLTCGLRDQQVLLKIASSLIEIFARENVPCCTGKHGSFPRDPALANKV